MQWATRRARRQCGVTAAWRRQRAIPKLCRFSRLCGRQSRWTLHVEGEYWRLSAFALAGSKQQRRTSYSWVLGTVGASTVLTIEYSIVCPVILHTAVRNVKRSRTSTAVKPNLLSVSRVLSVLDVTEVLPGPLIGRSHGGSVAESESRREPSEWTNVFKRSPLLIIDMEDSRSSALNAIVGRCLGPYQ